MATFERTHILLPTFFLVAVAFPVAETTSYNLGDYLARPLQVSMGLNKIIHVVSPVEQVYEIAALFETTLR